MTRVCLYSPADLNLVSGSSIWVQAVAETLHAGPDVEVVLPLRSLERRPIITGVLRRLPRVELVDPRRQRRWVPPTGLYAAEVLDLIERLDRERPFDAILLRSFPYCLEALERPRLRNRLWSIYVLEPERDLEDPSYVADLTRIASGSRWVVVQSEEMRALFEAAVPRARGRTILLPPAVPPPGAEGVPADVAPPATRLIYAGKYHPFYPVPRIIDFLEELRPDHPTLEFHAIGDQVFRPPGREAWADALEGRLTSTPGVVWHGAMTRDDVIRFIAGGGIALSLWDYQHGSTMNDLVVSTKLLDYCLAGVPVILNRTAAQESILGPDYPLFVESPEEALPLIRAVLADPDLGRRAAVRCKAAAGAFSYPRIYEGLAPFLEGRGDAADQLAARPKLPGSERRIGLPLPAGTVAVPPAAMELFRLALQVAPTASLVVGLGSGPTAAPPPPGRDPAAALRATLPPDLGPRTSLRTVDDPRNWWRTLGLALAPPGIDLDEASLRVASASGTRLVRSASELEGALKLPGVTA